MIEPSIGRVVWYQPNETDALRMNAAGQPLAALVAYVHSSRMVNLMVIDPNGHTHPRTSVTLMQEGDDKPVGASFAEWMPYQMGQAKKNA